MNKRKLFSDSKNEQNIMIKKRNCNNMNNNCRNINFEFKNDDYGFYVQLDEKYICIGEFNGNLILDNENELVKNFSYNKLNKKF